MSDFRDNVEAEWSEYKELDRAVHVSRAEVTIMSIGPADREWFDEHCPEWRDHVSQRVIWANHYMADQTIVESRDLMGELQWIKTKLAIQLASEVLSRMEPKLTLGGNEK